MYSKLMLLHTTAGAGVGTGAGAGDGAPWQAVQFA